MAVRNTKLYHVYHGMKQRCYNEKNPSYNKYGGRGITICDEWLSSYDAFRKWAESHGYFEGCGLTIDRIDSSAGYFPENCQWVTLSVNSARANSGRHKNKSKLVDPRAISPDGELIHIDNLLKFSEKYNLPYMSVVAKLHGRTYNTFRGWVFFSDMTRESKEGVTTIERITVEKHDGE